MDYSSSSLIYLILLISVSSGLESTPQDFPMLLLGNRDNIQLIQAKDPSNVTLIMDDIDYAMSCDYIYSDNLIFWMDAATGQEKIQSTFTNVSLNTRVKRSVVTTGLVQPEGLACDWIGKKLYWTDAETNRIEVSDLEGKIRKVLIWDQLDQPRAIAVDPMKGYMYWTDWGENPKIERAGMDGSQRQTLVERDGIYWPNGLTIDYEDGKVYWVDANYHYINRMNTDGTGREVVVSNGPSNAGDNAGNWEADPDAAGGSLQHLFAITLSGNRIYWTDWATNSIHSAAKNGSGQTAVVKENISSLHDIHSYGPHRQKKGTNPCGNNNGGCSHLCLISPATPHYSCACPTGVKIKDDGKTCKEGPDSILLLARRPDLRVISLDTPDFTDIVLPLQNVKMAVAVEYDPVDDLVYWSNNMKKAIFRARLDGRNEEKIVSDEIEQCDGIAVDWVARNLYWAEAGRNYIAVSRLNGTSRKFLIKEAINNPRAIALDPAAGQMYWSDWGEPAKIERASLDGTDRYVFVNTSIHWPNGLAIDYKGKLLYWAEAYLDKIEVIGLNGSGRRVLLEEKIPHIFGFSLLDDYLYWSDWEKRKVERMLIYDRKSRHSMIDELPDLMGIKASKVDPIPVTNPCANANGGCSHLCLYTPKGARCQCPNGQELLSDMKNCIEPEAFLLFTLSLDGVRRIALETAPRGNIEVPFKNRVGATRVDATHLDVSVEDDTIYWTDLEQMQIFRAYMNGTGVQSIVDLGLSLLEGIAIDWLGRNIYWADSRTNYIEMAKLDSTSRRPVIWQGLQTPVSIAVDPVNGYIYWSEWGGGKPRIRRAEMDGSKVETLLGDGNIGRANSLTIDYEKKRLYWVDLDANEIVSSNFTGGNRTQIVAGAESPIFAMTIYNEYIYWTRGNSIERASKINGSNRFVIQSEADMTSESIHDMLVYHTSRQSGVSACSRQNGGCEHICLSVPGGTHKCACSAHYKLRKDNKTCSAPENFLLFSQDRYISRVVFERGKQIPDAVLPIRGLLNVCAIDYDPLEDFIYWIDCDLGEIKKSRMNGTEVTTLLYNNNSLSHPFDLAVDAYGRLLYWTDSRNESINAMTLRGTVIGTVAQKVVTLEGTGHQSTPMTIRPRKIAVYPKNGKLFFSSVCDDANSCRPSIVRMGLDGSNCLKLFSKGLKKVSGLAVDTEAGKLYWSDEAMGKIEYSDLDGGAQSIFCDGLTNPSAVTVFGLNVYWIDMKPNGPQIEADRKDKQRAAKGHPKIIQGMIKNLQDIVGVSDINRKSMVQHPCFKNNGGCSHICIGNDDGTMRCSCPVHLKVVDDTQCAANPTCKANEFTCLAGDVPCIPGNWRCDTANDCKDGSDERSCPPCHSKDTFRCGTGVGGTEEETARATEKLTYEFLGLVPDIGAGLCVPIADRCDGKKDCADGSDEIKCPCKANEFRCTNGQCIPLSDKCDGVMNCKDRSDEACTEAHFNSSFTPGKNYVMFELARRHWQEDDDNEMLDDSPSPSNQDSTMIIVVISVVCSAVIIAVIIFSFKRRKSRNDPSFPNGSMVMFTRGPCGEAFQVNLEVTHGDHVTQVNHRGGAVSHPAKPAKKGSGGRSTASVNVSIGPPNSIGSTHMVNAHMPPARPILPGQHPVYGTMPYPSSYNVNDHGILPSDPHFHKRPNVTGASSSSSSSRTNKQFPPTLNPPPSPATDRSGSKSTGECQYSSDSPSTRTTSYYRCRNGHRHRSHHHRAYMPAPHPTPCPSDSYDDCMSCQSGASGREFDTVSRRSKSGRAPSSPPPPYCPCYHHYYHPYVGYGGGYHGYLPPSSYHSSHHGCHTPPLGHDVHQHSSSSSGSTRLAPQECSGPCCRRQGGRYYPSSSSKGGRGSSRHPPRYNVMSSDVNSDSDPFAPPPTPRSQYMSDCCYTHDEAEDNQEDESGSDPTRFINRVEKDDREEEEAASLEAKETDCLIAEESDSKEEFSGDLQGSCASSPGGEEEEDSGGMKSSESSEKEDKTEEQEALLPPGPSPSETELSYPIFNPPPSPVTDSS